MLETSLHLYQPVRYTRSNKDWFSDYSRAISEGERELTLDISALLSVLALNYPCGDRTLLQEIKRQPWLSVISPDGKAALEPIPPHGFAWDKTERIADRLNALLQEEAARVCHQRDEIYILLSGGLDSRVVAGVLYQLKQKGILKANPIGLTWGLEDSRDVQYAKATAELLGFGWKRIEITPESLLQNIHEGFPLVGGLVPPCHLHRMLWFNNNVGKDALVLAASYGDSIGRAEFSGRHLLELDYIKASNPFDLIKKEWMPEALRGIQQDLDDLRGRAGNCQKYALCEMEMQCHYMRGMIAHVMNVINNWCTLYQMFTDPEVYGYIWSLHPARRDNRIYAALLEKLHSGLARLPWARTNKALRGKTVGAKTGLRKRFCEYAQWSSNELYDEIKRLVEPDWFEATGIFDPIQVDFLNTSLAPRSDTLKTYGSQPYDIWLWLAGFRVWSEKLQKEGKNIRVKHAGTLSKEDVATAPQDRSYLRRLLSGNPLLYKAISSVRRRWAKAKSIRQWPPIHGKGAK
jgi:hypothetical protein